MVAARIAASHSKASKTFSSFGLKVNTLAQVIRPDGSVVPSLYAGGGTAAGFSGKAGPSGYLSANGLLAALVLGKIAGEAAAEAALNRH